MTAEMAGVDMMPISHLNQPIVPWWATQTRPTPFPAAIWRIIWMAWREKNLPLRKEVGFYLPSPPTTRVQPFTRSLGNELKVDYKEFVVKQRVLEWNCVYNDLPWRWVFSFVTHWSQVSDLDKDSWELFESQRYTWFLKDNLGKRGTDETPTLSNENPFDRCICNGRTKDGIEYWVFKQIM